MSEAKEQGIIPCTFRSSFWGRLTGAPDLSLDQDGFSLIDKKRSARFGFAELTSLSVRGKELEIVSSEGRKMQFLLPSGKDNPGATLEKLYQEFSDHQNNLQNLAAMNPAQSYECFKKCFEFSGAPYVRAAEILLALAVVEKISDFHFEPQKAQVRITARRHGQVFNFGNLDLENYPRLLARVKYLAGCLSHVSDRAQEGAFRYETGNLDVRVSCFPTDLGERLSLRFIQPCNYQRLDLLGWSAEMVSAWRKMLATASGLFIVSGPVGSGKTTALYASLAELAENDKKLRVVTIEDPVEGRLDNICQSSLDSMRDLNLAQAFKHLLRQDPDVIALGEIRDRECLKEALQAGLSGHLVLATFHAGRGDETLARIKQIGIEDYLVTQGLRGILCLELAYQEGSAKPSAHILTVKNGEIVP